MRDPSRPEHDALQPHPERHREQERAGRRAPRPTDTTAATAVDGRRPGTAAGPSATQTLLTASCRIGELAPPGSSQPHLLMAGSGYWSARSARQGVAIPWGHAVRRQSRAVARERPRECRETALCHGSARARVGDAAVAARPPSIPSRDESRHRDAHRRSTRRSTPGHPAAHAVDLRKTYGTGAGDGARPGRRHRDVRARPLHRGDGPVGVGQVDADALHGRARPPDIGPGLRGRPRHRRTRRRRPDRRCGATTSASCSSRSTSSPR